MVNETWFDEIQQHVFEKLQVRIVFAVYPA